MARKPGRALDVIDMCQVEVVVHCLPGGEERDVLDQRERRMTPVDLQPAPVPTSVPVKNDFPCVVT